MTDDVDPLNDPAWLEIFARINDSMEPIPDADFVYSLKLDFDPGAQLIAIRSLLARNRADDEALDAQIRASQEHAEQLTGIRNDMELQYATGLLFSAQAVNQAF